MWRSAVATVHLAGITPGTRVAGVQTGGAFGSPERFYRFSAVRPRGRCIRVRCIIARCIMTLMDLLDLYRLGSALVDVSRRAMVPRNVQFDFDTGEAIVMARLFEGEDGRTISQLAELTGFAQSRVSTLVAHLYSLGWVTRETDPRDRRR